MLKSPNINILRVLYNFVVHIENIFLISTEKERIKMEYGYVRVSTKEQHLSRQLDAMRKLNILKKNVYCDKFTGATFDRPGYQKLLRKLTKGDILYIHDIDRLGRDYDEILANWRYITQQIGADIVVLNMDLLDTRKERYGLTGKFIADIVLQILSFVAEKNRESIKTSQREGIIAAKKRGTKFGRPKKEIDMELFNEIVIQWRAKEITCQVAIEILGISRAQFFKLIKLNRL